MTVRALITEGIGPGGSVLFLLTGGLGLGAAPVVVPSSGDGDYFFPREIGGARKRKRERPEWEREDESRRQLEDEVRELYERVVEGKKPPAKVAKRIGAVVAPFVEAPRAPPRAKDLPPAPTIDFAALLRQTEALDKLLSALARTTQYREAKRIAEEIEIERDDMEVIEALMRELA